MSNMKDNGTFSLYLKAGLAAGSAAALVNILIYLLLTAFGGHHWSILILGSVFVASFVPNLLAAAIYAILSRLVRPARTVLSVGIALFVLVSILPHLGIGPAPSGALAALPDGFDLLTIPLHLVFGLTALFLMPWIVARGQGEKPDER